MEHKIKRSIKYFILIVCIVAITICIYFKLSLFYGFYVSIIVTYITFLKEGYSNGELVKMIKEGVISCWSVFAIIVLMGAMISMWIASGVVPTMIYYGLEYISRFNFLLMAFLITSMTSIFMGTALGTVSTIGIALMGIGMGLTIPNYILLGAIVSGAFIADKISPMSALVNLNLKTTEITYKYGIIQMLKTTIPTLIVTSLLYYFLGREYGNTIDIDRVNMIKEFMEGYFEINPILLLFPTLVVFLAILGIKVVNNMILGTVAGAGIAILYQGFTLNQIINHILWGFSMDSSGELSSILKGGGIISMAEVLITVLGVVILSSLLDGANIVSPIIIKVTQNIRNKGALIARTGILSALLTTMTCDQTIGIIIPGKMLKEKFKNMDLSTGILARTISDTGSIVAPLAPWNVNSIVIASLTGIATFKYAPYAIFCYIAPIVTILSGFLLETREKRSNA
ncbi:Na+/H+ antiporter NhaC family protein [Clostridiisalibacter paucivorans]|uniref:Na+/H+ antiporter NhaC family protein n=1 Tax=Clostridiisalibacter paucivorans TaxID=408753 RepID=UPI0005505D14|nr:Na+/H+ antiporter NhaC family protein [Clostridiisalibacter paucivorans]